MSRYLAVTTCNAEQWGKYGREMVKTFCRYWPSAVPIRIYTEDFICDVPGVEIEALNEAAQWLEPWKAERTPAQRGLGGPKPYLFKQDAVRFSHKIAAIGAAAEGDDADVLIWMDADIVTHSPVTIHWLDNLLPFGPDIAWLDRDRYYPECGFLMFRLPESRSVIRQIVHSYQSGAIFEFAETHDSYVFQVIVGAAIKMGQITVHSLSGPGRRSHHPFVSGPLGEKMDHLKGRRKAVGRTSKAERLIRDGNPYWT